MDGGTRGCGGRRKVRGVEPFIGSEALAAGVLTPYELRRFHRRLLPNVFAVKGRPLALRDRTVAAWLWSRREGIISGLAAAALHGTKWVDADVPIELIWPNHRAVDGVITRNETLLDGEVQRLVGMPVTTPERTAFDLARRASFGAAVALLAALSRATGVKPQAVLDLAARHPHLRGLRRLPQVLDMVDPGAESPKETWLRLLLIDAGFPRPQTQIPVLDKSGYPRYFLDMGWPEVMVAAEYDGEQYRTDRYTFRNDIIRSEYIASLGWRRIRVVADDRRAGIVHRVRTAWSR